MNQSFSSLGLSLSLGASLLMPLSAHAYLTPDQVFGGSSATDSSMHAAAGESVQAPPTLREGADKVAAQQEERARARAKAQEDLKPVDAAPVPVDTYVPDENVSKGLFDEKAQYQKRQDRIEADKNSGPTIIIGGDTTVTDANGNVLHSGAPRVSSTGPASMLAIAAMLLAGACTFLYVQYRSRRVFVSA